MDRILTTHAGSLPRPPALVELLSRQARGDQVDTDELAALATDAVDTIVARQVEVGIDIVNDGEQARESFFTYLQHRLSGFSHGIEEVERTWRDVEDFPGFAAARRSRMANSASVNLARPPVATGEVAYVDPTALDTELARFAAATAGHPTVDRFMTAPSPGIVVTGMANRHYESDAAYLDAIGAAIGVEYRRIVDAGMILQIDAPDLAMERHASFADRPLDDFLGFASDVIATINREIADLPPERIRLHVCWGNYGGPHVHDVALSELLPVLYDAQVSGLLVSGANPRHEHEFRVFTEQPLPVGWTLATGVIDTTTNYVEHPEVVADRIERVVHAVGTPARVLACTDCGFDTSAGFGAVAHDVVWAKLAALRDGADLATTRLHG